MRVVIDTNVIVSGLLYSGVPSRVFALAEAGRFELIASVELRDELAEVLPRAKFAARYEKLGTNSSKVLRDFESQASIIDAPCLPSPICRDPDDDRILACAVAGAANAIVTGDRDLLTLGWYQGIEILTPAVFLARFATP